MKTIAMHDMSTPPPLVVTLDVVETRLPPPPVMIIKPGFCEIPQDSRGVVDQGRGQGPGRTEADLGQDSRRPLRSRARERLDGC